MSRDVVTETVTPDQPRRGAPTIPGVVAVFTEGVGPLCRAATVRDAVCIGRADSCDLVLDDPKASRQHARIEAAGRGVLVVDLGSRNGVVLDGQRTTEPKTFAAPGSTMRIGNTLLKVVADAEPYLQVDEQPEELLRGLSLAGVRRTVRQVATSRAPLLVCGESGVGKELVAQSYHEASGRHGPLVAINCAAVPRELIEAELFGHAKGAFSGADSSRQGVVRSADGGTLFLDEIADMPLSVQAKLLRVLESGQVRPVGEDTTVQVDLRLVSATNVDLDERVIDGAFRDDLYHRIAAVTVEVPPLRQRGEDIALLFCHFLAAEGRGDVLPSADAAERLLCWHWPGNVRELRNVALSALARLEPNDQVIRVRHLPANIRQRPVAPAGCEEPMRAQLETALAEVGGNVSEAARRLGMRRARVYEQLNRLGIDPSTFRRRG